MSSTKSFTNALMLAIATLAVTACVPKATEKKAVCGKNEAFSSVSRSCYSIEELRAKPVGVTSKITLSEETPQTITLAYTDANKDQALTCKISSIPAGLEMITPSALDGGLNDKADEVYLAVSNLAAELAVSEVAMRSALLKAKASVYFPTTEAQFGVFRTAANFIIAAGAGSLNPNAQFYYTLGQQRMLVLNKKLTDLANRCECSAGVCTTVVIPKLNKTAPTGFSYTITDLDGESDAKAVAVTIDSMSGLTPHLAPVARSGVVSLQESDTSVPSNYSITIPTAADLTAAGSIVPLKYYFKTTPGLALGETPMGYVTNCMDLPGSTGPTDISCTYTPKNGNAFDTILVDLNASKLIGDLTYTAVAKGISANSYSIQYYSIKDDNLAIDPYANDIAKFGLISNAEEAFIRVVGNSIKVFIHPGVTSSAGIANLITSHPQASKMVTVSAGSLLTFPDPSAVTPSAVFLTGGTNGFDKISFYAQNNSGAVSSNAAAIHIRMASVDDYPILNLGVVAASDVDEDVTPIIVNLKTGNAYIDVDTDLVAAFNYTNVCQVTTVDPLYPGVNFTAYSCSCVLDVCYANLTPTANASGIEPFTFQYRIGSVDVATPAVIRWTDYRDYKLTINPINDEPILTLGVLNPLKIPEGSSGYMDIDINPGGSGYESTQSLDLTVESDKPAIFPDGSITIGELPIPVAGKKRITFTPAADQSGTTTITYTLKDDGGVVDVLDVDTNVTTFSLTVTPVNNPPVFKNLPAIVKIETNEGGAVQSDGFHIDEDATNSEDEDMQSIIIDSIVSDNHSVLPNNAIKIFYDLNDNGVEDIGEVRTVGSIIESDPTKGVELHKLYLKLNPVDGIAGNANVTMTISDHVLPFPTDPLASDPIYAASSNSISKQFSLIVHPIAALHGGWNNISSVGVKTDKNGTPAAAADVQCEYNRVGDVRNCGGADCTGGASPNSSVVPNAINAIYWDSSSLRCYRSTAANAFSWVDMNTSCPINREVGTCPGNNCFNVGDPTNVVDPDKLGQYILDTATNTCYVSSGEGITNWIKYTPAKVTLAWKPFILSGSGPDSSVYISGWNVYRREVGTDFNFKGGHLKNTTSTATHTITDPSVRTFTDTTAIAGRVYYYAVRPVDSIRSFPTYTPESFSEVRVIASPSNYSFVHRWIVNQEICNGMHITTTTSPYHVDQTNNFRCEYNGPGSVDISGTRYYDYGKDLLVDTQEAGCAYAAAPKCTANGCVGIGSPVTNVYSAAVDDLYYDRKSGACYINTGGATWGLFQNPVLITNTIANKTNSALNAPLTNLTKADAIRVCNNRDLPALTYTNGAAIANVVLLSPPLLPNKKDYMAYASQRIDMNDIAIANMEQGSSLNIESGCNSSSASGLGAAFTDSGIPSTSFIYSLPGTFSSGIRSIYTGSIPWAGNKGTEACVSRFGIQDLYGNVAEWVDDGMTCDPIGNQSKVCTVNQGGSGSFTATDYGASTPYSFNNVVGPYNEFGDAIVTYPTSQLAANFLIGDTSLTLNSAASFPNQGVVIVGTELIYYNNKVGATLSGLVPFDFVRGYNSTIEANHLAGTSVSYGPIDDTHLTNWTFADQFAGANYFNYPLGLPLSGNINQAAFSAYLDWILPIGTSAGVSNDQLHEDGIIVNGSVGASKTFAVGGSYLSGRRAGRFSSELIDNTVSNRPDVGFRCIVPIPKGRYPIDPADQYPY